MAFGDVNLSEDPVKGKYAGSPGAGGWPTIRYYNKETGFDGKFAGEWKDEKGLEGAMCDVFGKTENMQAYVEEMAGTSLCKISDGAGCSEKEKEFIAKWTGKEGVAEQIARLQTMKDNKMAPELKSWVIQRLAILKQFSKVKEEL